MELTPYRKSILIVEKLLEFAEIGGMEPLDCGAIIQAFMACLGNLCPDEDDQAVIENLLQQIKQIIKAKQWDS